MVSDASSRYVFDAAGLGIQELVDLGSGCPRRWPSGQVDSFVIIMLLLSTKVGRLKMPG